MEKTEKRIERIIAAKTALGYTIGELERRSDLGYATIWRIMHYFDVGTAYKHEPRKTTLKTLESVLGLDR